MQSQWSRKREEDGASKETGKLLRLADGIQQKSVVAAQCQG
jgi:hypothetical protein